MTTPFTPCSPKMLRISCRSSRSAWMFSTSSGSSSTGPSSSGSGAWDPSSCSMAPQRPPAAILLRLIFLVFHEAECPERLCVLEPPLLAEGSGALAHPGGGGRRVLRDVTGQRLQLGLHR